MQFFLDNPLYTLILIFPFWLYSYVKRSTIPLVITSVLFLFFNMFFLMHLPERFFSLFSYGIDSIFLIRSLSVALGVWGLIRSIKEGLTMVLDNERVLESRNFMVEGGAGRGQWVLGKTEQLIIDSHMPGITTEQKDVTPGLFGEKRKFLVVRHSRYKEWHVLIGARSFGEHLDASWFLVVEPGFFKRTVSKNATGNPTAFSQKIDPFSQQDIKAFKTVAYNCFEKTLYMLHEELQLDPSGFNADTKGYLNVW
jgi:hypothetical protein